MRYDRKDIRAGMHMQLDCPISVPVHKSAAPRFGQPFKTPNADLREIEKRIEAAKKRLAEIAVSVRRR